VRPPYGLSLYQTCQPGCVKKQEKNSCFTGFWLLLHDLAAPFLPTLTSAHHIAILKVADKWTTNYESWRSFWECSCESKFFN